MVSEVTGPGGGAVYTPETGHGANGVNRANRHEQHAMIPATPASDNNVVLTEAAVKLHAIEQAVAKASPVDDKRVETVKKAIEDGSYQVDPQQVADKLIELESLLPQKPKT